MGRLSPGTTGSGRDPNSGCRNCRSRPGAQVAGAIRIAIVAAQPLFREALSRLLEDVPCVNVVACTGRGDESLRSLLHQAPDLVLVGPHLPDISSEAFVLAASNFAPPFRTMALVTHPNSADLPGLLNAGAAGQICLTDTLPDMLDALHVALDKRCLHFREKPAADAVPLSKRERELVGLLAQGASQKDVAAQMGATVKTVETFRLRVASKLGARTTAELVALALHSRLIAGDVTA